MNNYNNDVWWVGPKLPIDNIPALLWDKRLFISILKGFPNIDSPPYPVAVGSPPSTNSF